MRGLRTQESVKFNAFFALIQTEAGKENSVFFADAGDGNVIETQSMECEEMMGWLVPNDQVEQFEPIWNEDAVDDDWTDCFCWAEWFIEDEKVKVRFAKY